jgi:hypothetical protein
MSFVNVIIIICLAIAIGVLSAVIFPFPYSLIVSGIGGLIVGRFTFGWCFMQDRTGHD